jgi:hypothetical protein
MTDAQADKPADAATVSPADVERIVADAVARALNPPLPPASPELREGTFGVAMPRDDRAAMALPPVWQAPDDDPPPDGSWCSRCRGRRFDRRGNTWSCTTCLYRAKSGRTWGPGVTPRRSA